jgi:hypothetical protein
LVDAVDNQHLIEYYDAFREQNVTIAATAAAVVASLCLKMF